MSACLASNLEQPPLKKQPTSTISVAPNQGQDAIVNNPTNDNNTVNNLADIDFLEMDLQNNYISDTALVDVLNTLENQNQIEPQMTQNQITATTTNYNVANVANIQNKLPNLPSMFFPNSTITINYNFRK